MKRKFIQMFLKMEVMMLVNNYIFKRISAYFIDFMIVAFIAAIFSEIAIKRYPERSSFFESDMWQKILS